MTTYILMLVIPALFAFGESEGTAGNRMRPIFWAYMLVLVGIIGLRFEVGGDWLNYLWLYERARILPLSYTLGLSDAGYMLANWLSARANVEIWGANLICAVLFVYGLGRFCRSLPRPWLALLAATPYLILAVAMGYSRQGVAVGLVMAALVSLGQGKNKSFFVHIIIAALFHKTAVLLFPLAFLGNSRNILLLAAAGSVGTLVLYQNVVAFIGGGAYDIYIEGQLQSSGTLARLALNALPAILYLTLRKRMAAGLLMSRAWLAFAVVSLALIPAYFLLPYSTIIDRIGLYLIPLQLFVYSHLPRLAGGRFLEQRLIIGATAIVMGTVMLTWLNLGTYADEWLPYEFYRPWQSSPF
jgi:hypothetical protein